MRTARAALAELVRSRDNGRLESLCERNSVDIASAFGSATDPNVSEPHDLDVAVRFTGTGDADVLDLAIELAELLTFDDIDVLDLGHANVVARSRALGSWCVPLYERSAGLFAVAQMAALAEAMETAAMRRRDLELLARR